MVPFKETANSKEELVELAKKGFQDFTNRVISKNDFCMFFGFTHGEAITKYYKGNYGQLLLDAGFNSGSEAYFSGGINAWINLKDDKYTFPPIQNEQERVTNNVNLLNQPLQQIYYGAPGTGKSHQIDRQTNDNNSIRTTFHPDTDYATFVGAYKPMMDIVDDYALDATGKTHKIDYPNEKKSIIYKYEPQVFLKAYVEAWKRFLNKQDGEDDSYYLVIEEINRGNCAQIFGDLFQLLDREDSGYSSYAISPESSITKYLAEESQSADGTKFSDLEFSDVTKYRDGVEKIIATADDLKAGKRLVLPPNLHIWATMNTSDQSLFPIDSAFKRRWDWQYVAISYTEPKSSAFMINVGDGYKWVDFIKQINKRIFDLTQSEDKELGNFFIKDSIDAEQFKSKVMFYLWYEVLRDEVENSKYFFYYTQKDEESGKETNHKFTFNDLYGDNAGAILEGFLKYITKGAE